MNKLTGTDIQKARYLFEKYDYYQAVIFSVFEGQYDGSVYTDDRDCPSWALLQTPFSMHFITGNPADVSAPILDEILFSRILDEQVEKGIIVFFDNEVWNAILGQIFAKHGGRSDFRKIYAFSGENYLNFSRLPLPVNITTVMEKRKPMPNSRIDTWSAEILSDGQAVSVCDAHMVGNYMAEINIVTEKEFRGRGYATIAATLLVDKLLEDKLTPCWSTWPDRVESQRIAQKLGFVPQPDVTAWIWTEGMRN